MSDDLIRRQDAIDAVKCGALSTAMVYGRTDAGSAALSETVRAIKALPSAQPEIIRCKDCKYYAIHELFGRSQGWCERLCDEFDKSLALTTESDDYCSRAER